MSFTYYPSAYCNTVMSLVPTQGKHVGCAEQVLTEKTMKKLCFSLVWHEKVMIFGGYSSLRGRVSTPACSPGPVTSFLRFLQSLKILIFLNRNFHRRIFQNMSKILTMSKIWRYNRKLYRKQLICWKFPTPLRNFRLAKILRWNFNYIFCNFIFYVYIIQNNVPRPGEQI